MLNIFQTATTFHLHEFNQVRGDKIIAEENSLIVKYMNLIKCGAGLDNYIYNEPTFKFICVEEDRYSATLLFNFPVFKISEFPRLYHLLLIPLFKMKTADKIETMQDFFKDFPQAIILTKIDYLKTPSCFPSLSNSLPDNVVKNVNVEGKHIQYKEEQGCEIKPGYFVFEGLTIEATVLYLGVFILPPTLHDHRKSFIFLESLSDISNKKPEHPFIIEINLDISSFKNGLRLGNSAFSETEEHSYIITFDKQELIQPDVTLKVELKGKCNGLETEFVITKTYSDTFLNNVAFNIVPYSS
ncbi:hypothetical protein CDIK_3415 [Cucumispora dikerogammari]|nr:hypothetical protein CDIK_3415 [Cucumispora dikerogammari]